MSDKIIDFNELKNKVKDKDVDKFEDYIYSMYYQLAEGKMNMAEFSKNIMSYMEENNISQDKLINIQKKFLERYGVDPSMLEEQFKIPGFNLNNSNYSDMKKTMSFQEKYNGRLTNKVMSQYYIKNGKNTSKIIPTFFHKPSSNKENNSRSSVLEEIKNNLSKAENWNKQKLE
jgi:hypothetical protein